MSAKQVTKQKQKPDLQTNYCKPNIDTRNS